MGRTLKNFLFDRGAILATNAHFWQSAAKFGVCLLPQLVIDEIKRTADDASVNASQNSSSENAAVEFVRFLPQSKWQITDLIKPHPELSTTDNPLSRNARLSMLVGQYAYGVSEQDRDRLTVLVTDDQGLIRKINELNVDHLCATTTIAVKQWVFTGEVPTVVERAEGAFKLGQKIAKHGYNPGRHSSGGFRGVSLKLLSLGAIAIFLGLGSLLIWQHFQPKQFNQFWQKTGLPKLPITNPR
jgi:hypothetical protein